MNKVVRFLYQDPDGVKGSYTAISDVEAAAIEKDLEKDGYTITEKQIVRD